MFTTYLSRLASIITLMAVVYWFGWGQRDMVAAISANSRAITEHRDTKNVHMTMAEKIEAFVLRKEFEAQASVRSEEIGELKTDIRSMELKIDRMLEIISTRPN